MSYTEHAALSVDRTAKCAVLTVSDTRTTDTDLSGALMKARLAEAGHEIGFYGIIRDEPAEIVRMLDTLAGTVDAILINGGTGISPRDTTYEAVAARLEKTLPGFGELFRMLSYAEIGSGAMLSRATAGAYRKTLVFSVPGSTGAVRLALEKLILPELNHLIRELNR